MNDELGERMLDALNLMIDLLIDLLQKNQAADEAQPSECDCQQSGDRIEEKRREKAKIWAAIHGASKVVERQEERERERLRSAKLKQMAERFNEEIASIDAGEELPRAGWPATRNATRNAIAEGWTGYGPWPLKPEGDAAGD